VSAAPAPQRPEPPEEPPMPVVVKDIDVPIGRLVALQFKLLIAAIPVAAVVLAIYFLVQSAMG
jgi:hypothetical protein